MAGAILLGAGGFFAIYHRLRPEFDRVVAILVIALLIGATPLFWLITHAALVDVAVFALVALLMVVAQRYEQRRMQIAIWAVIIAVPLLAIGVAGRQPGGFLDRLF